MVSGKHQSKVDKVRGTYDAEANLLDVKTFTVDGETKPWCGQCKAMYGSAAKMSK